MNSWWKSGLQPSTSGNPQGLQQLLSSISNSPILQNGHMDPVDIYNSAELNNSLINFLNSQSGYDTTAPKAFVNWIAFDERFNYVAANSGYEQVAKSGDYSTHTWTDLPVSKNGYVYIYVSNETPNIDVFFDNLQVTHIRGPLIQDQAYSAWGLELQGLSSSSLNFGNSANQKLKYNGKEEQEKEFANGGGLEWLDYGARMYDNQIGRFFTQDRFSEKYYSLSPYQYAVNDPFANIDYNGDSIVVVVKSQITNADGTSGIKEARYHYQNGADGLGFYDQTGNYVNDANAIDPFLGSVSNALGELYLSSEGAALINYLIDPSKTSSLEILASGGDNYYSGTIHKSFIRWNPKNQGNSPNEKGGSTRPPRIGLAHELAHIESLWKGINNSGIWIPAHQSGANQDIQYDEIYASHRENQIRKQFGIPLRTHYSPDASGLPPDPTTRIVSISKGSKQSIYVDQSGNINSYTDKKGQLHYTPLKKGQIPYTY